MILNASADQILDDADQIKALMRPEYHEAYDLFRQLDPDQVWAAVEDPQMRPFWVLTKSDETYYCMKNGGFHDAIFNDAFHALDTGDKIDIIDAWVEFHGQEM